MATIDTLDIQIQADAQKANIAIDTLINSLTRLSSALNTSYGANLSSLAMGVQQLGLAMATFKANANAQSFNSLSASLNSINSVNTGNLNGLSGAISQLNSALSELPAVRENAKSVRDLANALSRFGSQSVTNAVINIPRLERVLIEFMASLSKAPAVRENVIRLVEAIGRITRVSNGVQGASRKVSNGLNSMANSSDKARRKYTGLASAIGKFYATYFLAIRGIKKLSDAIESSMDYVETYNYFAVTMDKIGKEYSNMYERFGYESAEKYAESFTNRMNDLTRKMTGYKVGNAGELDLTDSVGLGLDPNQLMQFEAKVSAITNSIGLIGETSINTAKAVSMLSADLSSLTNTSLDTVMTNLSSGLIGQSRAMYKYGIDITNATLQTYAYAYGIDKAMTEMTQAEKMQLRLLAILDQSRVAWGDQANTINSVANQSRVLTQQFHNMSRTIGNLFLPIVQKALPVINGMVVALNRLFTALGFSLWGENWLKQLQDGISGGVGDDLEELGEDAEGAAKKVKKLNDNLQGFDEINKLSEDTDNKLSGFGDETGLIDLSKEIADALADYETVWEKALKGSENKINAFADKFEKLLEPIKQTFLDLFNGDFYSAGQDVGALAMNIFNYFSDAIGNVNWDKIGTNIAKYWNGVFSKISGKDIARGINNFTNAMWTTITSFIREFDWGQIPKIIGDLLANLNYDTILKLAGLKLALGFVKNIAIGIKGGFDNTIGAVITGSTTQTLATKWGNKLGGWITEGLQSPLMAIPAMVSAALISANGYYEKQADVFKRLQGRISDDAQAFIDRAKDIRQSTEDVLSSISSNFSESGASVDAIQLLADKYFDLAENIDGSQEKLKELEIYKQQLIEQNPEFEKILNDTTQDYKDQRDAVNDLIASLKVKAMQEAASSSITDIASQIIEQQNSIDEMQDKYKDAQKRAAKLKDQVNEGQKAMQKMLDTYYDRKHGGWQNVYDEEGRLVKTAEQLEDEFNQLFMSYGSTGFLQYLEDTYGIVQSSSILVGNVNNQFIDTQNEVHEIKAQLDNARGSLDELNVAMDYYSGVASGTIETTTSLYEYQKQRAEEAKNAEIERAKTVGLTVSEAVKSVTGGLQELFAKDSAVDSSITNFVARTNSKIRQIYDYITNLKPELQVGIVYDYKKLTEGIASTSNYTSRSLSALTSPTAPSNQVDYNQVLKNLNVNVTLEGDVKNFFRVNTQYGNQTGFSY